MKERTEEEKNKYLSNNVIKAISSSQNQDFC